MKIVFIFVTFLVFSFPLNTKAQIQELASLSELIIKGKVISSEAKWNESNTLIITKSNILVESIFKGKLIDSIIAVNTIGGILDEQLHLKTHELSLSTNEEGYFFLKSIYGKNEYIFVDNRIGFALKDKHKNMVISSLGVNFAPLKFEEEIIKITKSPKLSYLDYKIIKSEIAAHDYDTCDISPLVRNINTIEFTFDSVAYTSDFQYIEFDIMAKVNTPGLKFGKGELFIRYNKAFGKNVVSNGLVEVSKGEMIADSIYEFGFVDTSEHSINLSVNSEFGSNQMYTFTSIPAEFVHVKIKIDDFNQFGAISFDSIDISGSIYYWCQGNFNLFDHVNLDGPISSVNSQPGSEIGITYTYENLVINQIDQELSLELFAEATNNSKYSDALIYINYNELAFGSNVVSSGNFSFKQQDLIFDPNIYQISLYDIDPNTILIVVFSLDANSLSTLSTIPRKLGTLNFEIMDCEEDKGIHFDIATETSEHTHFTGAMPIPHELYNPVIANDEERGKICGCIKPIISSFSPATIHAGTGEVLTIIGENFGNWNQQECTVLFPNGDNGGSTMMEAGAKDFEWNNIVHWTDTEIQIKVPSTDKNQGASNPACTGKFQVRNECDISDKSMESLHIPYAILNARNGQFSEAYKITLRENSIPGICFQFADDTPGWIVDQFENALNSWCNETGINFTVGSTVSNTTKLEVDGINIIKYGGQNSNVGGAMAIEGLYYNTICSSTEIGWVFSEIDFIIYSGSGDPASQEAQLREVFKHELGHAHMLAHAKNNTATNQPLMNYQGNLNGSITSADSDGANLVFGNSQAIVSSCGTPIGNGNCAGSCSTNSIKEFDYIEYIIWPNPTVENVELLIKSEVYAPIELIEVFDFKGKRINRLEVDNRQTSTTIELPSQSGIYLIKIFQGGLYFTSKVIKL